MIEQPPKFLWRTNRDSTGIHFSCGILSNLLRPPIALKANDSGERPTVSGKGHFWSQKHTYLILIPESLSSSPKHFDQINLKVKLFDLVGIRTQDIHDKNTSDVP